MHFKTKKIKGHTYLSIVKNKRINGRVERTLEMHVGTADKLYQILTSQANIKVVSFPFGKIAALLHADERLHFTEIVNEYTKRRKQPGLTVGQFLLLLIAGRSEGAHSRRRINAWFKGSALRFLWTPAYSLSSQNCLNYMKKLTDNAVEDIELNLARRLLELGYSPTKLIFDTTNSFTYIEKGEKLLKKGNSKQKRFDKNIVGVGLLVDNYNLPFKSEVYPGNEHDAEVFVGVFKKVCERLEQLKVDPSTVTLVFDKGVNSDTNIKAVVDKMHIVGSLPRDETTKYCAAPLDEFEDLYEDNKEHMIKGRRFDDEELFGKKFTIVITYNEASYKRQKETYERGKQKILANTKELQRKATRKGRGRKLTLKGAMNQLVDSIPKQYRGAFDYGVTKTPDGVLNIHCDVIPSADEELHRSFGKVAVFTDNKEWPTTQIAQTYNSKSSIEDDFKWLNDKVLIPLKPFFVRKDIPVRVHIFLCVIGLLMYRFILIELAIKNISPARLVENLNQIKIAIVKTTENKADIVVEEMPKNAAKIFATLRLDRFVPN
jgi:transposase